jgi:transposase
MRELSVAEQRYQAVMAVIGDGLSIRQVAEKVGVSRQTLHAWLARYEAEGLEGLKDRSHRPVRCPHQMSAEVEAMLLELRRISEHLAQQQQERKEMQHLLDEMSSEGDA